MTQNLHLNPNTLHPIAGVPRVCYLKNIITSPQICVGDYTYYDDPDDVHKRFDDETTAFLLELAWWDWPIEKITQHVAAISTGDFETLRKVHAEGLWKATM